MKIVKEDNGRIKNLAYIAKDVVNDIISNVQNNYTWNKDEFMKMIEEDWIDHPKIINFYNDNLGDTIYIIDQDSLYDTDYNNVEEFLSDTVSEISTNIDILSYGPYIYKLYETPIGNFVYRMEDGYSDIAFSYKGE